MIILLISIKKRTQIKIKLNKKKYILKEIDVEAQIEECLVNILINQSIQELDDSIKLKVLNPNEV